MFAFGSRFPEEAGMAGAVSGQCCGCHIQPLSDGGHLPGLQGDHRRGDEGKDSARLPRGHSLQSEPTQKTSRGKLPGFQDSSVRRQ